MSAPLLDVDHVGMTYIGGGWLTRRTVRAVDDVSLRLEAGKPEILAVIGESGSGKTTLARMILSLATPSDGAIRFRGTDARRIRSNRARMDFMRQVQPIFQNPFEAFNPLKRLDRYLFVSARRFAGARGAEIESRAVAYVDWSQQEFGIAASLSGDAAMMEAYRSGDPYLTFGKQAGVRRRHHQQTCRPTYVTEFAEIPNAVL